MTAVKSVHLDFENASYGRAGSGCLTSVRPGSFRHLVAAEISRKKTRLEMVQVKVLGTVPLGRSVAAGETGT